MIWLLYLFFKHSHLKQEFNDCPMMLQHVVLSFVELSVTLFGIRPTLTRILDKVPGDSGVHYQYRAVDARDEHGGKMVYTEEQAKILVTLINQKYNRLDEFDTVLHHSFAGGPVHFHFQIPNKSINMRGPMYAQK